MSIKIITTGKSLRNDAFSFQKFRLVVNFFKKFNRNHVLYLRPYLVINSVHSAQMKKKVMHIKKESSNFSSKESQNTLHV